ELEKSLWLGSVPGPAVVGLALNWPVPWPPADQPAVAQPTGLGTASFVEFASLPWWLVPVATTLAVHGTTGDQHDSRDHKGRHGRDEGRHGRSGDRRDRPQTGGVLGLTPLQTNLNLAAQFAVEWSTVALLVDVDADQVGRNTCRTEKHRGGHDGPAVASPFGGVIAQPGVGTALPGIGTESVLPGGSTPVFLIFADTHPGTSWDFALTNGPDPSSGHRRFHPPVPPQPASPPGLSLGTPWVQVGPWAYVPWTRVYAVAAVTLVPVTVTDAATPSGPPSGLTVSPDAGIAPQSWMLPWLVPAILDAVFGVPQNSLGDDHRHCSQCGHGRPGHPDGSPAGPPTSDALPELILPPLLVPVITVVLLDPAASRSCTKRDRCAGDHDKHGKRGRDQGPGSNQGPGSSGGGLVLRDLGLVRLPGTGLAMPTLFPTSASQGLPWPQPGAGAWVLPVAVSVVFAGGGAPGTHGRKGKPQHDQGRHGTHQRDEGRHRGEGPPSPDPAALPGPSLLPLVTLQVLDGVSLGCWKDRDRHHGHHDKRGHHDRHGHQDQRGRHGASSSEPAQPALGLLRLQGSRDRALVELTAPSIGPLSLFDPAAWLWRGVAPSYR
ncbi:MAG: hypothetical protein WBB78_06395, partial [Propionicimonas sp.]